MSGSWSEGERPAGDPRLLRLAPYIGPNEDVVDLAVRLVHERDNLLLLVDSIGRDCVEAIGGRPMDALRRASLTASREVEGG